MSKYINISDLSKILNLIDKKTKKPLNYILRYWEKEFKEIKPTIIRNRRYYSVKQVELIKLIKFLLKDKGLRVSGVKRLLKSRTNKLDENNLFGLKASYYKNNIEIKSKNILEKIRKLRSYGKKNTY
tara:strand:+ start:111 stop:491 length:381 start_codon:yes stop_codon:yes gene_type:complete